MELIITELDNKKTNCLNMIVKNEADIIVDTFNNILSYIDLDYWVISDTGSTDNTKEVIINYFKEKRINGELIEHDWKDFGYNRSKALECAYNKTDYLLIFDADDRFYGNFKLPHILSADSYYLKFGKGFEYTRPLLINNRKQWCFKGVLHEYLSPLNDNSNRTRDNIIGDYYVDSGKFGNRSKNPNKALDDAIILKEAYEKELLNPTGLANRYAFYCAQSYKDCNENIKSIEWYKKVLTLDTWEQEKYYACLMIGDLYNRIKDEEKSIYYWLKTVVYDSERIEGIVNAMEYYRATGQHLLVNSLYYQFKNYNKNISGYNKLFIDTAKYKDLIEYNNSISSFYTNDKKSGYECCKKIIINNILSDGLLINTIDNMLFYQDLLDQDLLDQDLLDQYNDIEILFNKIDYILDNNKINKLDKKIWKILYDKLESKKDIINLNNINKSINKSINISINDADNIDTIVTEINYLHSKKQDFKKAYEIYINNISILNNDHKDLYKLYYEYSIFAFYIGIKIIDKEIISIFNNCDNYNTIRNVLSNMKFYKNVLIGEKTINLELSMNHLYNGVNYFFNSSSSCIIPNKTNDGYLLNARLVNYRITENGNYVDWGGNHIVTMNKYIELTNNFEIQSEKLLEPIYKDVMYIGIEDIRIFNYKNTIYHIGTVFRPDKKIGICKGIYDIVNNPNLQSDIITAAFNMNSECEKNWVYFNYNGELRIVYNWFPLKICKINEENNTLLELVEEKLMPNLFKYARGSTCGAEYNNELWFVLHIVSYESPRHYYHLIVVFDKNMNLLRYSAPFKFEGTCIEYCIGLIVEDSRVIMTYSNWDRTTKIGLYDKSYIDSILLY
jgi:hypothetical protein